MTSPDETPKPFQFGLRSIFLATLVIAVGTVVLKCLGPWNFILLVQFVAVITMLVISRGAAWPGVLLGGIAGAILGGNAGHGTLVLGPMLFFASLAAWFGGGIVANKSNIGQPFFVRRYRLVALLWILTILVTILVIRAIFSYFIHRLPP